VTADPVIRGLFVTGTDTGVGKTLVAAALARFLRRRGIDVAVCKPVESGVDDPSMPGADAELLRFGAQSEQDDALLAPLRLRLPLAPAVAAEQEGTRIAPESLLEPIIRLGREHQFLIVEGCGGLMVPLAGGYLVADLVRDSRLPLLTVCRPGLGTINHTLLTLFTARSMGLPLAGFLVNGLPERPDLAEESAPHTLASLASADLLGVLPRVAGDKREKVLALADELERLPTLPWLLSALKLS
jgi:dethiobiotin synthetase